MKNTSPNLQQNKINGTSILASSESFDFDIWARAVKRQMIALLKKRASE
ncbi:MAG: hypothetical protein AB1589_16955 [Cyanobacteriota bacterium]